MSLTTDLRQWRKDRNITEANTKVYVANIIEELLEIFTEDKKEIKHLQSKIMDKYFNRDPLSEFDTLDSIQDIQTFSINETELMGYDNHLCNQEVFKEIDSRLQDPEQRIEWEQYGAFGKWKKSQLEQDKKLWYKADYLDCKRKD